MQEKQLLHAPCENMNAVFKIGLDSAQPLIRCRLPGDRRVFGLIERAVGRIKINIYLIGKDSVHSDKRKVCIDFLLDAPLILGMKIFHDEDAFADFVKLFDAPSGMIDVDKILFRISLLI